MTTTSAGLGTRTYEKLASTLRADLITPGDPGYDGARTVYHATIDRHPGRSRAVAAPLMSSRA